MVQLTTTVEPDPSTRQAYDEGYIRYKETYAALAPLFHRETVAHGPV
jgi:sugar (pentulose or hexulose) kinase